MFVTPDRIPRPGTVYPAFVGTIGCSQDLPALPVLEYKAPLPKAALPVIFMDVIEHGSKMLV